MPVGSLGKLVSGDGRTRMSGIATGIDSDEIIKAFVETKMIPVKKMEDQVKFSNEKVGTLTKLRTYLQDLQTSADALRSVPGYSSSNSSNLLSAKKVVMSSDTIDNPVNYLDISASSSVDAQIFSVRVNSVAKTKIQQTTYFSDTTSSITDISGIHTNGRFTAGTFQINGTDISLVAGDSLANITSKINAVSGTTKVSATIIQPSVGQYRIQLKSSETGLSNAFAITDTNTVLNDTLSQVNTTVQSAADAQITINNNITVSRPTNTITDYINGLTIKIYNQTADNVTVDIDYDKNVAADSIVNFVEKYNSFISYAAEQQARDGEGKYLDSAKIRDCAFLTSTRTEIISRLSTTVGNNGLFESLWSIGISFPKAEMTIANPSLMNSLQVDGTKLSDVIHTNFDKLRKLLEFQYTSTSSNYLVTKRSNSIATNTTFSVNVDVNRAANERAKITYGATTINATFTPNDSNDLTKGGFISGPDGTPFEGFEFQYTGAGNNETTDIVASQGVMDKMYNALDLVLKKAYSDSTGTPNSIDGIDVEIAGIQEAIKTTSARIDTKKTRIETEKEAQIAKYAAAEARNIKEGGLQEMLRETMNAWSKR